MQANSTDNSHYTDGFPTDDNPTKKEGITSRDPSRPFDSGRKGNKRESINDKKSEKKYNPTGTTMNEPDRYKK